MSKSSNAMKSSSQSSNQQEKESGTSLQSPRSTGSLASKPSWTKLQQDNLKAKRAMTHHQSQGFNGLVK